MVYTLTKKQLAACVAALEYVACSEARQSQSLNLFHVEEHEDCKMAQELKSLQPSSLVFTERADVRKFQEKFHVPMANSPSFLDREALLFRTRFLVEELHEFVEGCRLPFEVRLLPLSVAEYERLGDADLCKAADALVDLAYVLHGTVLMMGLPWAQLWGKVQRANMSKERAKPDGSDSKRGSALDVVKPAGWRSPDHSKALGLGPWPIFEASK